MKRLLEGKLIIPFMLLVSLVVATGCGAALSTGTYTAGDNGRTIAVMSGDTFTVKLDENPTTGYSWNLSVGGGLKVVDSTYVPNATGLIGSGGYHIWTIRADKAGTYPVTGIYKRPWEPTAGNESKYSLTVKVTTANGSVARPNMTFPAMKKLFDLKPKFSLDLESFFGHFPLFGRH